MILLLLVVLSRRHCIVAFDPQALKVSSLLSAWEPTWLRRLAISLCTKLGTSGSTVTKWPMSTNFTQVSLLPSLPISSRNPMSLSSSSLVSCPKFLELKKMMHLKDSSSLDRFYRLHQQLTFPWPSENIVEEWLDQGHSGCLINLHVMINPIILDILPYCLFM